MKPYLDTMRRILTEGKRAPNRTGIDRIRLFGTQTRYAMSDGFPLDTTREIFTRGMIEELLFFISGSTRTLDLEEKKVNIWKPWTVKGDDVEFTKSPLYAELQKIVPNPDALKPMNGAFNDDRQSRVGTIGPMYGNVWRNLDDPDQARQTARFFLNDGFGFDDIPSDFIALLVKENEENEGLDDEHRQVINEYGSYKDDFKGYALECYFHKGVDQLGNLMYNLKKHPYEARHCVTAWIPQYLPLYGVTPEENVLLGFGALPPCHAFFQCFVEPPEIEGGKDKLSLQMYQRSCDYQVGVPYNVAQYSLLLCIIAHCLDMEAGDFIHPTGDTHIYVNQISQIEEQLKRVPGKLPRLWLNPNKKDLFSFTVDDIKILDYNPQEAIKCNVAK